jgi:hypothetical protein
VGDTLDHFFWQNAYRDLGPIGGVVASADPAHGHELAARELLG